MGGALLYHPDSTFPAERSNAVMLYDCSIDDEYNTYRRMELSRTRKGGRLIMGKACRPKPFVKRSNSGAGGDPLVAAKAIGGHVVDYSKCDAGT